MLATVVDRRAILTAVQARDAEAAARAAHAHAGGIRVRWRAMYKDGNK